MENEYTDEQKAQMQERIAELRKRLKLSGIPVELWGMGAAKTIEHLARELAEGESVLVEQDGQLVRSVVVAGVDVFYEDETGRFILREDRQVFNDGRERRRNSIHSVSEKMRPEEEPEAAFRRGLAEELSEITDAFKGWTDNLQIGSIKMEAEERESRSFPGLRSIYTVYSGDVLIPKDYYRPEGYVERQADKSTYFAWQREVALVSHTGLEPDRPYNSPSTSL